AGFEITIRDLVQLIARLMDFAGEVRFDPSKPDGQPRRSLDTARAERLFGFRATTSFEHGLRAPIAWYRSARARGAAPGCPASARASATSTSGITRPPSGRARGGR